MGSEALWLRTSLKMQTPSKSFTLNPSEDTAGFLPDFFFLNFLVEKFFSYDLDVSSGVWLLEALPIRAKIVEMHRSLRGD